MPLQRRMLALCLWHSLLAVFLAASPAGGVPTRATPPPRAPTEPAGHAQPARGRWATSVWPLRAPTENRTPSFLPLPFNLPFDLWSPTARSRETEGAEGSSEKTETSSSGSNSPDGPTREEPFAPARTGTATPNATSDPPTPAATVRGGAAGSRRPHAPRLVVGDTQPAGNSTAIAATRGSPTSTPASRAGHEGRGEPARSDDTSSTSSPSAPFTATAKPAPASERAAGAEPKTDAGSPGSGTREGAEEERTEAGRAAGDGGGDFEDVAWRPTRTEQSVSAQPPAGTPLELSEEDSTGPKGEEPVESWAAPVSSVTPLGPLFADLLSDEDWPPDAMVDGSSPPPDCDIDTAGLCNASGPWGPAFPEENATSNQSYDPFLLLAPPMFVPLYSDWNSAMATWGVAWEAHVYGLGAVFALVALASALNLLCLPFRCPSGCGYFALVDLFLLTACCSRAFSLFYDAYSHQDKLPASGTLLLYEVPFPCLTAAFGIVFLLLSMRSRMQLSNSVFQHPCFLAVLVLLHFGATLGSVVLLQVFTRLPCLFFVSQGSFVALAAFLSAAYFAFYCYVRADAKHIYHLNNTSPPADRYHRCPFADPKDWDRAAVTAVFSAIFALACAGLQLYAMLHALGLGGVEVFHPWPWWAFHLSCRVCEAGVCLTLALVVVPPLYCSGDLPQPGLCWPRLFCVGARGRVDLKSPVLPGNYQWSLSQQEKLVICDAIARRESECLPLYTLVDTRLSSLDGLDLLYHGGRLSLGPVVDDDDHSEDISRKSSPASLHPDSDSTGDLRPPSPINLRRSIDEALFGEALFPRSFFGASRLRGSSELSLDARGVADGRPFGENPADRGLYRTSSCVEMERPPGEKGSSVSSRTTLGGAAGSGSDSSGERWRGSSGSSSLLRASLDGSSLVLCSSPEGRGRALFGHVAPGNPAQSGLSQAAQLPRRYRTLGSASQESLGAPAERDLAVQAEFISVCRQIDALSVCSDTIDL